MRAAASAPATDGTALAVMGCFALCLPFLVGNQDPPLVLFCVVGTAAGALLRLRGIRPTRLQRTAFLLAAVGLFAWRFGTVRGVGPGVGFLAVLSVAKSLELRTARDCCVYLLVVQLIVAGSLLLLESLSWLLLVALTAFAVFYVLMAVQRGDGRTALPRDLRRPYLRLFSLACLLSAPLFLVFPRLAVPFLNRGSVGENAMTGFVEELRVGEFARVYTDDGNVFRASFEGPTPDREELYWRGEVLNETDGMDWRRRELDRADHHVLGGPGGVEYTVTFEGTGSGHLFNLADVARLSERSRFHAVRTAPGIYRAFPLSKAPFSYTASTAPVAGLDPPADEASWLGVPAPPASPRLDALLARLRAGSPSPGETAARIGAFLREGGLSYTHGPGTYGRGGFLDDLLFGRREGHCAHYASAAGILLRLAGVPARVVVGFQGGTPNPYAGFVMVRGADAHAWVEYWDGRAGWTRFDPTAFVAPGRLAMDAVEFMAGAGDGAERSVLGAGLRRLRFQAESVYYALNSWFLNYDLDSQRLLFQDLLGLRFRRGWALLACLLLLAAALPLASRLWRGGAPKDPAARAWRALARELAGRGVPVLPSDGPLEALGRCAGRLPPRDLGRLAEIARHYLELRYGPAAPDPARERLLARMVARFRGGFWRRWVLGRS